MVEAAGVSLPNPVPGCPPVVFLKAEPTKAYTTIGIDNAAAARTAVAHLVALGRTRIAHIAGPLEWREARDRRDGWLAARREMDTDAPELFISERRQQMSRSTVWLMMQKFARAAGLSRLTNIFVQFVQPEGGGAKASLTVSLLSG